MKQPQQLYNFLAIRLYSQSKKYLVFVIFAILVVLFYGNTLGNEFVLDDIGMLDKNIYVQSFEHFPKVVTGCLWGYANRGCKGRTLYYRPVQSLSYLLTYQIVSAPWIFHVLNAVYFFVVVSLVYLLASIITRDRIIAVVSALIFLIHPINSGVVNWISAVSELLLAIFVLLTVILYFRYRSSGNRKYLFLVCLSYFFAILSKEPAVLLPVILLAVDTLFFKANLLQRSFWLRELKTYVLFLIPVGLYLFMRVSVIGFSLSGGFVQLSFIEKSYSIAVLFGRYIRTLFYPYPLSVFHEFEPSTNFLSLSFIFSFFLLIGFIVLTVLLIKKGQNILAFSLVWFAVFLSPVLIFLDAVGDNIFSERYVFVSTIGFALFAGTSISYVVRKYPNLFYRSSQRIVWISLIILLLLGSWTSLHERNKDWKDNETISLKTLSQNSHAYPMRAQLARWYLEKGEFEKAREQSEELIRIAPNWKDITIAYKSLGDYYQAQENPEKALAYYLKATETSRSARDYVTYNDVGTLYMDRGEYLRGFAYFCQSLQLLLTEATQNNFDTAVSLIDEEYIQQGVLYTEIASQFTRAPELNIRYQDKRCDETSCQYAFAVLIPQLEVIPPFLIVGVTFEGDEIEITNRAFDPAARVIILDTEARYENVPLSFIFPTCGGFFYEPVVQL